MRSIHARRNMARVLGFMVGCTVIVTAFRAGARPPDATVKACVDAHANAQLARRRDALLEARRDLKACASSPCPGIVRADCTTWMAEVVEAIPSVIFDATLDGENTFDASVWMDGVRLADSLDGRPIEVDPGLHTFVFARSGFAPVERRIIVPARLKNQLVSAAWRSPVAPKATGEQDEAAAGPVRPVPTSVYVLGSVALAATATFAVLGATGTATQQSLEGTCAPRCPAGQVSELESRFLAADVAAGIGAAATIGTVVLFLVRPEQPARAVPISPIAFTAGPTGASIGWEGAF